MRLFEDAKVPVVLKNECVVLLNLCRVPGVCSSSVALGDEVRSLLGGFGCITTTCFLLVISGAFCGV